MLKVTKNITLSGRSMINDVEVEAYTASIDSEHPDQMNLQQWQVNKQLRKENRDVCRQDQMEFENAAYKLQDELIAAISEREE